MVRFVFAGLAMLAFAGAAAAEEDNGPALVDLFDKTCALRPALPSEIDRIALGVGFVRQHRAITADMEARPRIDILYSATLMKQGEKISLTAYFEGPADGPTVVCTLMAVGVSADALPGLIAKSLSAHDRTEKAAADNNLLEVNWRAGEAGGDDTLEMRARRDPPRRAAISLMYHSRKR